MNKIASIVAASAAFAAAASAQVTTFDGAVAGLGTNLDTAIPGSSGISNANFVLSTNAAEGISLGLKAHERFIGDLANTGDTYFAAPGTSGGPPSSALLGSTWNWTWAINLGTRTFADVDIEWKVDFDPAANTVSWVTSDVDASIAVLAPAALGSSIGGSSENLNFNFWSTTVPFLLDASGYLAFDPNALGEYESMITVRDKTTGNLLAEASAIVVVPTPGAAGLLALAGLAAARRRRA